MNRRAKYKKILTNGAWRTAVNHTLVLPDGRRVFTLSEEASRHFCKLALSDAKMAKLDYTQQPRAGNL